MRVILVGSPKVSVVIPAFNEHERIGICIAALKAQSYPPDLFEILVVDNDSDDGTADLVRSLGVKCLKEPRRNAEIARNTGVRAASGEVLAFTDADCVVDRDWLARGVEALANADLVAGHIQFTFAGQKPRLWELFDASFNLQHNQSVVGRGIAFTANLMTWRRVFQDLRGFPEDCFGGGDLIFTRRATTNGLKLEFIPAAIVHHPARSFRELSIKALRIGREKGATWVKDRREKIAWHSGSAVKKPHLTGMMPGPLAKRMALQGLELSVGKYVGLVICNFIYLTFGLVGFGLGAAKKGFRPSAPKGAPSGKA